MLNCFQGRTVLTGLLAGWLALAPSGWVRLLLLSGFLWLSLVLAPCLGLAGFIQALGAFITQGQNCLEVAHACSPQFEQNWLRQADDACKVTRSGE